MYVSVSTDGCLTCPVAKARELGTGAGGLPHDKPWINVAPDGKTVLACWDYGGPESTTSAGTPYLPSKDNADNGVVCSVSHDKADSWSRFSLATNEGGFPWLDRRDDPNNPLFATYYSYSLDGGATFAPAIRVASALSDEKFSHHQNGMIFLGDYRDMGSAKGAATMVWVDTRNEKADVFVATVERPSANP